MKKLLSVAVALFVFMAMGNAQIHIEKSPVSRSEQLTTLTMSWCWLYQQGDEYYIAMKTDNVFDNYMDITIGKTKEECLATLESLKELIETITDSDYYYVDKYTVKLFNAMGAKGLTVSGKGYAGNGYLYLSAIKKASKWIEKNR